MLKKSVFLIVILSLAGCATVEVDKGFGIDPTITKYDSFLGLNDLQCSNLAGKTIGLSIENSLDSSYIGELMNPNAGIPIPYNYEGDLAQDIGDRTKQLLEEKCGSQVVSSGGDLQVKIDLKRAAFQVLDYEKNGDDPSRLCIGACELIWDYKLKFGTVLESGIDISKGEEMKSSSYEHNLILSSEVRGKYNFVAYLGANYNTTTKWVADYDDLYTVANMSLSVQQPRMGGFQAAGKAELRDLKTGETKSSYQITKDSFGKQKIGFGATIFDREFKDPDLKAIGRLFGGPEGNLRTLIADMARDVVEKTEEMAAD